VCAGWVHNFNRFNGFGWLEPAKAVVDSAAYRLNTQLKQGVNEKRIYQKSLTVNLPERSTSFPDWYLGGELIITVT